MTDVLKLKPAALKAGMAGVLALLIAGAGFYGSRQDEPAPTERWVQVTPAPLEHRIGLVGRIVPGEAMTLIAPFEGHIEAHMFAIDQRVAQDQLLLRISPDLLHLQIREALAERLKAESAVQVFESWADGDEMARARRALSSGQLGLADTQRKLAETQALLEQGIVPRMEVDSLTQQLRTQSLDVSAAQAELAQVSKRGKGEHRQIADMQLASARARHDALLALEQRGEIRAPFSGIVLRLPDGPSTSNDRPIAVGARVSQGQALFGLASVERLKVQARVDEVDINQLHEGMPAEISGDGFNDVLHGTITAVGAQAIESDMRGNGASYHVTVSLPPLDRDSRQRLRLGMSARLSILIARHPDAVVLPTDAVGEKQGGHFVIHRAALDAPESMSPVTLGKTTVSGVEVFGMDAGFVRREVSMD